jgi:hypothetical protein
MKLTREKGDLLEFYAQNEVDFIGHCCNCQGVMGSGIASSIKEDFPTAYDAYKEYESAFGLELGTISEAGGIFNLHAQHLYGKKGGGTRFVDYEGLYESLVAMRENIEGTLSIEYENVYDEPINIGFPYKMAADRAGGDWIVIEAMIVSVFKDTNWNIFIVEFDGTRNA